MSDANRNQFTRYVLPLTDRILGDLRDEITYSGLHIHYASVEMIGESLKLFEACIQGLGTLDDDGIHVRFSRITHFNLKHQIPFVVTTNHLNFLRNAIVHELLTHKAVDEIVFFCDRFDQEANGIARDYLMAYADALAAKNADRLASLDALVEKSIIRHYENHIIWLNRLVDAIRALDSDAMPEISPRACKFGRWLHENQLDCMDQALRDNIHREHDELHRAAKDLKRMLGLANRDFSKLYTYIQKAELLSLNLGNALALLSNCHTIETAAKDPLTGVLSRQVLDSIFFNQLDIGKATDGLFSLILTDIDHFKKINDNHGHVTGDKVLKAFADILQEEVRTSDFVFRYGGEEFLLILPSTTHEQALAKAERIRGQIETRAMEKLSLTASFGVAEVKPDPKIKANDDTLRHFIQKADEQLYLAKRRGRNRVL